MQEIQKQLQEARGWLALAEATEAKSLQTRQQRLKNRSADITAALPQHEAADVLVSNAEKITSRLTALQEVQKRLQTQLATLRKSSVEWRSKATDAEQQIAAIAAQRPELDKKIVETKARQHRKYHSRECSDSFDRRSDKCGRCLHNAGSGRRANQGSNSISWYSCQFRCVIGKIYFWPPCEKLQS